MPITIPKPTNLIPKLVKAKVPVWLVAAIVAADVVAVQLAQPKEPICTLKVDYPHHSTSVKKYSGVDAIKVNIVSKCDVDQSYTLVDATILEKVGGKILNHDFLQVRANADSDQRTKAFFKNLWKTCKFGSQVEYAGKARGEVHLVGGKVVSVSDDSGKYFPQKCQITAK